MIHYNLLNIISNKMFDLQFTEDYKNSWEKLSTFINSLKEKGIGTDTLSTDIIELLIRQKIAELPKDDAMCMLLNTIIKDFNNNKLLIVINK